MRPSYSVTELIPHRLPMALIDEIIDVDLVEKKLTAAIVIRPEWKGNWVAIEYMAQTAAALAGAYDRMEDADSPARPGFLLGTRRLTLDFSEFEVGARYLVTATCEFRDAEAASFYCTVVDARGKQVANAILNAYRPADVAAFLKEQS